MPRDLKRSDHAVLVIHDSISSSDITLHYRIPTAEEHIKYQRETRTVNGDKVEVNEELRMEWALALLTGFREGDLLVDGKPISAEEGKENYDPSWKQLIKETAADWLMILAGMAFDYTRREITETPFVKP
jgi:hypothetical protein